MPPLKIVLVGDSRVGKSTVLARYRRTSPTEYKPTVYDMVTGERLTVIDTDGDDSYIYLRPLAYVDIHLAVIIFALNDHDSFARVRSHWIPEVKQATKTLVLLGTKSDMKHEVSRDEIAALVTKYKMPYFELGNLQYDMYDVVNRAAETRVHQLFDALLSMCPVAKRTYCSIS